MSLSVVFTLTPVMAAGFGWLAMGQRTGAYTAASLALAAAGALWVIFDADLRAAATLSIGAGEALMLAGCAAHAAYAALVPRLSRGEGALTQTLGMLVAGSAILAVIAAPDLATTPWAALPGVVWLALIYLAIASSAVSFFLVQYAGLRLPAAKVMAYTYLTPAWVILWEGALGHGWPPPCDPGRHRRGDRRAADAAAALSVRGLWPRAARPTVRVGPARLTPARRGATTRTEPEGSP